MGEERNESRPDSEVGTAGVVAPHRGHPAGVCPDVARPRLGDVQGPVGIQPQARGRAHVDRGAALLPHVPDGDVKACKCSVHVWLTAKQLLTPLRSHSG